MTSVNVPRWQPRSMVVAACLGLCSTLASAAAIVSISGGSNFPAFNGTNQTIGWAFTVAPGAGLTVTSLGWWDSSPATPLDTSHQVGIWTATGTLLGSVTVQATSALSAGFRYEATTPFELIGGEDYIIGGEITSPFQDIYNVPGTIVTDPMITLTGSARNASSGGFSFPSTVTTGNGRIGPNFEFTVNGVGTVPEPSTLLVAMTALGLLGFMRRHSAAAPTAA